MQRNTLMSSREADEDQEVDTGRAERLAGYCADAIFNDGCEVDDDNSLGERFQDQYAKAAAIGGGIVLLLYAYAFLA